VIRTKKYLRKKSPHMEFKKNIIRTLKNKKSPPISSLFFSFFICLYANSSFGTNKAIIDDQSGLLSTYSSEECEKCSGGERFKLALKKQSDQDFFHIEINEDARKIRQIRLFENHLLIVGDLPYGGDVIFIADIKSEKIIAKLYAYDTQFSPNNKEIIFKQFYPRAAAPEEKKTIIRFFSFKTKDIQNIKSLPEIYGSVIYPKNSIGKDLSSTLAGGDNVMLNNNLAWGKSWVSFIVNDGGNFQLYTVDKTDPKSICVTPFFISRPPGDPASYTTKALISSNESITVQFYEKDGITPEFKFKTGLLCGGSLNN
jgi:hypothetical protein